jgi:hypothetical protein
MSDAPALEFEFISTMAPVQAEGTVAGRRFYFRARTQSWAFTLAQNPGDDPVELGPEDVSRGAAWYRTGEVLDGPFAASYLPLDEARSIIRDCAREYISGLQA